MKKILLFLGLLAASPTFADTFYHGHITQTGTLGDGTIFIEFAAYVGPPGCSHPQVRINGNNPAAKSLFATALAAYLTHTPVKIQTDSCLGAYPTLTTAGSWLYPFPL